MWWVDIAKLLAGGLLVLGTSWVNRRWARSDREDARIDQHQALLRASYEEYLAACRQYIDSCILLSILIESFAKHANDVDAIASVVLYSKRTLREIRTLADTENDLRALDDNRDELDALEENVDIQGWRASELKGVGNMLRAEIDRAIEGARAAMRVIDQKLVSIHFLETNPQRRRLVDATATRPAISGDREAARKDFRTYAERVHALSDALAGAFAPQQKRLS